MQTTFRKANVTDAVAIWNILENAIAKRKAEGSSQWQDGYPNETVVHNDIEKGVGFVLMHNEEIVGYSAVLINDEPEYANIQGKWLTNNDFVVVHRIAIAKPHLGKGLAQEILKQIEAFALSHSIYSIKVDTNFDNIGMLKTFEKLGYSYCGEVHFRGSARRAYEKVLEK